MDRFGVFKQKSATRKSYVRIQDLKRKKHEGDFQGIEMTDNGYPSMHR
jgi:ribosomal protein S3AE